MHFCSQCGSQLIDGARFCASCGASVNVSTNPVPLPAQPT
ncbi:zinc-ribbon domain-containing protein [Bifidobacterium pseudocatenulatum]